MNTISRIQVEFGEPAMSLQIPLQHAAATESHLSGMALADSSARPDNFTNDASSTSRSFELNRLIARIRQALRKEEIQ